LPYSWKKSADAKGVFLVFLNWFDLSYDWSWLYCQLNFCYCNKIRFSNSFSPITITEPSNFNIFIAIKIFVGRTEKIQFVALFVLLWNCGKKWKWENLKFYGVLNNSRVSIIPCSDWLKVICNWMNWICLSQAKIIDCLAKVHVNCEVNECSWISVQKFLLFHVDFLPAWKSKSY